MKTNINWIINFRHYYSSFFWAHFITHFKLETGLSCLSTCHTSLKTWVLTPRIHEKVDQTARMPHLQLCICQSKTYSRGRKYSISSQATFFSVHSNYWQRNSVSQIRWRGGWTRKIVHSCAQYTVVYRTSLAFIHMNMHTYTHM